MLQHKLPHCWIILLFISLSGCQSPKIIRDTTIQATLPDNPPASTQLTAPLISDDAEADLINIYLEQARVARRKNRLTTPVDDNAYLRYLQVLALAPEHPLALMGLADLADQYLAWALREINSGDLRGATDFTNKARSIDENHLGISAVESLIQDRHKTRNIDYMLADIKLSTFSPANAAQPYTLHELHMLVKIARRIDESNAPIVIFANSDALGRQIYQFLNGLTHDRISAQFELREQASVRLMIK
jgi:hypothetical protein